jgi:hypothetical protein
LFELYVGRNLCSEVLVPDISSLAYVLKVKYMQLAMSPCTEIPPD